MRCWYRHTPEWILVVYTGFFFTFKHPSNPWDRVINSDGKGYYAYLPAVVVYHDLTFTFVESYEQAYYPEDRSVFKEFRMNVDGHVVNKYFAGLAILWIPFFLAAHLVSILAGQPADGYGIIYQYAVAFAALFYLWLGCKALMALLRKLGAQIRTAAGLTWAVTLGTNMIFFGIVESSMTHIYSFALTALFILAGLCFFETRKGSWFWMMLTVYGLVILTRPSNGLVILLAPFLAGNLKNLKEGMIRIVHQPWWLTVSVLSSLAVLCVQPFLYYLQTGHWWVYSYGTETFRLLHPQIASILVGYNRGWLVYSPLVFLSFFGFIRLYRENKTRFFSLLVFMTAMIYLLSCWWLVYYASKCGQRVFIDIYAIIAILLFYLVRSYHTRWWKYTVLILTGLLILLNLWQSYQHIRWIFPAADINGEIYWDAFFSGKAKARAYLPANSIKTVRSCSNDMEENTGWINEYTRLDSISRSGSYASCISDTHPFSAGWSADPAPWFETTHRIVRVSAWILANTLPSRSSLVVDLSGKNEFSCYSAFYFASFLQPEQWTLIECAWLLPEPLPENPVIKIYFYHPPGDPVTCIDDFTIDFISVKPLPEFEQIEGLLVTCPKHVYR